MNSLFEGHVGSSQAGLRHPLLAEQAVVPDRNAAGGGRAGVASKSTEPPEIQPGGASSTLTAHHSELSHGYYQGETEACRRKWSTFS